MVCLWFQACCLVTMLLIPGTRSSVVSSSTPAAVVSAQLSEESVADRIPCGEDLCWCSQILREAECLNVSAKLTSLPRLPDSVRVLKLSFDAEFRNLTNDIFFYNTSHITSLHLLASRLESLNNHSFLRATNLTSLYIYREFVRTKTGIPSQMEFIVPLFSIPSLRFLDATKCDVNYGPQKTLDRVGQSQIETLYLGGNLFPETFNLKRLKVFKQLKVLDLAVSGIGELRSTSVLKLRELYLDDNSIEMFLGSCRGDKSLFPNLEVLSLSYNHFSIDTPFVLPSSVCLPRLETLWLDHNRITSIPPGFFNTTNFPSLTELHTQGIARVLKLHQCAFCNKKLTFLTLASNRIHFAEAAQAGMDVFGEIPHLQTLLLDNNNFTNMNDAFFQQLFGGLRSLETLSLSNCYFNTFTTTTFAIFPNLSFLNLSNNGITVMPDGVVDLLPKLRVLDLSKNHLASISEALFSPQISQTLLKLNLSENRFQCTCQLMWFSKWMATDPDLFDYPNAPYNCRNLPGTDVVDFSRQEHACLLTREANVLIIFGVSLVTITLLVISLVYRYRWHVRMLLYEVFRGRDTIRRQYLQTGHFQYDLFVSYASEDLPWIRQHLMPNLVNHLGLRLCIHETDFLPGKSIMENIVDCVQKSKKVLVVFSEDFSRSPWCQFELTYCLRHVMDYDDALIIVCLGDVVSRNMTSAMMAVLKTTTYIQWAEEEEAVLSFWRRLRLALQEVTMQAQRV